MRIDLVPALRDGVGFLIPERGTQEWIRTRPASSKARLTQAESRSPEVRAAVRLLKGWSRARGHAVPLSSYAMETIVVSRARASGGDLGSLVLDLLGDLADAHAGRRLVLAGEEADETPVTVWGAQGEGNLAALLSAPDRVRLVEAARWTCARLAEAGERVAEGRACGALLREAFVGRRR